MIINYCLFFLTMFIGAAAAPGDKAKEECRTNAMKMIDCQRLVNGSRERVPADYLKFPHMAVIGYYRNNSNKMEWLCGASLITPLWIVTAAHCAVNQDNLIPRKVKLGTATMEFEEDEDFSLERNIVKMVLHPNYKMESKYDDIALFKLSRPVPIGQIRIACLRIENTTDVKSLTVSGFGKEHFLNVVGTKSLMHVEVDVIPQDTCRDLMSKNKNEASLANGIVDSQLCAGDLINGGKDSCQGDSGGPLQGFPKTWDCVTSFPLFTLYGIVSFGSYCGFKQSPGIYTRVSSYVPWIESVIWPD